MPDCPEGREKLGLGRDMLGPIEGRAPPAPPGPLPNTGPMAIRSETAAESENQQRVAVGDMAMTLSFRSDGEGHISAPVRAAFAQ